MDECCSVFSPPEFQVTDSRIGRKANRPHKEVTRALLEHMAAGAVVDIGANCGYFSLLAASRGARVYAFAR
jgi:predicted RNA methylase